MIRAIWAILLGIALLSSAGAPSLAQGVASMLPSTSSSDDASTGSAAEAIAALEAGGATVVVIPSGEAGTATPDTLTPSLSPDERLAQLRARLGPVMSAALHVPSGMVEAMRTGGGGSLGWLPPAVLISLLGIGVGTALFFAVKHFAMQLRQAFLPDVPETRGARIAYAFTYIITSWVAAVVFLTAGTIAVILVEPNRVPERVTAVMLLQAIAAFLAFRGVVLAIINGRGEGRLAPLEKPLAARLQTQLLAAFFITNAATWICFWSARFPLDPDAHKFMLVFAATFSAFSFIAVILWHRRALTAAFFDRGRSVGGMPARPATGPAKLMALLWPVAAVGYFVAAWAANVNSILLDSAPLIGPVAAPLLAFVAALAATGVILFVYDTRIRQNVQNESWTELFEKAAYMTGCIVWLVALGAMWGAYGTPWGALLNRSILLLVVLLACWIAWRAVNIAIDQRLAEEMPAASDDQASEGEGFGPGASRIATLLPILRNVMLFFIGAVVLMSILASLGVDVGPLFAGAGVLGLAIGFGAQALIRDVFSGAFFLLDDAFRRGEYIDVGGTAGMVEKISVRSFQLRHHEGPLHTLPFGEIKQLTNYSRDWVIMKLPIRLTYDTDIEKVRKLVKKVGLELAADPELGHYFLEPPKSQGVVQMEDSAMIIRVKFMTKPGDQFLVRKHVFQRIRDAFIANDIHFAHREVTVRVSGTDDPQVQRAAAGAAAPSLSQQPPTPPVSDFAAQ